MSSITLFAFFDSAGDRPFTELNPVSPCVAEDNKVHSAPAKYTRPLFLTYRVWYAVQTSWYGFPTCRTRSNRCQCAPGSSAVDESLTHIHIKEKRDGKKLGGTGHQLAVVSVLVGIKQAPSKRLPTSSVVHICDTCSAGVHDDQRS